jgi:hypothetical protein
MRSSSQPRRRWLLAAGLLLAGTTVAGLIAFRMAVSALEGKVAEALGPTSEIGALRVSWLGVVIEDLRIPAPAALADSCARASDRRACAAWVGRLISDPLV